MGNECPRGPCKELTQLTPLIQSLFKDFERVEPGFSYDVDGYTRFFLGVEWTHTGWNNYDGPNGSWAQYGGLDVPTWKREKKYEVPLENWKA